MKRNLHRCRIIFFLVVLILGGSRKSDAATEYALAYISLYNRTNASMWIWVTYRDSNGVLRKFDEVVVSSNRTKAIKVPVGKATLNVRAWKTRNPQNGRPFQATIPLNTPSARSTKPLTINPRLFGLTPQSGTIYLRDLINYGRDFSGNWECEKRAILSINQYGTTLRGWISGSADTHDWIKTKGRGTITGQVDPRNPRKANIFVWFPNKDYVRGKGFMLSKDRNEISGLTPIIGRKGNYIRDGNYAVRCERIYCTSGKTLTTCKRKNGVTVGIWRRRAGDD